MTEWVCDRCLVKSVCQDECGAFKIQSENTIEVSVFGRSRRLFLWKGTEKEGPFFKVSSVIFRNESLSLGKVSI